MALGTDTQRGEELGPFLQFLAPKEGLEGKGKEREEVVSFCAKQCGTHQPNCLRCLDLFPSVPHGHTELGPAPSGITPGTGVACDALSVQPAHPAQDVLGKEPTPSSPEPHPGPPRSLPALPWAPQLSSLKDQLSLLIHTVLATHL